MRTRPRWNAENFRTRFGPELADLGAELGARIGAGAARIGRLLEHVGDLVDDLAADSAAVAREAERLREAAFAHSGAVRDAVRAAPRFLRIVSDVLLLVAAYRIHDMTRRPGEELFGATAAATARARLHEEGAGRLYRLCVDLRGGVLKLGQLASSRIDLLPEAYVRSLGRLQDRVPPLPTSVIQAEIEAALGASLPELFSEFEPASLAAASLAQVHGARLADGTRVAMKVLVPGIEDVIETDLTALRTVGPALREVWPGVDFETIANELSRSLRQEVDLEAEATAAERFRVEAAHDVDVIVPRIHRERSAKRVLALERIDGARLPEWLEAQAARGEVGIALRDRLLEILVRTTSAQILERGYFHADPHPGNFLVQESVEGRPRLVILDFGCVQELSAERRRDWAQIVLAGAARDVPKTLALLDRLGFRAEGDPEALQHFAERLVAAVAPGGPLAPGSPDAEARLRTLVELLHESPIVTIPPDAVLLGRVLATLGGLLVHHRPRFDLFGVVVPSLLRAAGSNDQMS